MGLEDARSRSPAEVVQTAESKDFLVACLKSAKLDADLLEDIADACEINELNALILGSGELSPEQAADKLFLMQDEAKSLLEQCKKQCLKLGVDFGDGSVYVEETEPEPSRAPAPAKASPKTKSPRTSAHDHTVVKLKRQSSGASPPKPAEPVPHHGAHAHAHVSAAASNSHAAAHSTLVVSPKGAGPSPKGTGPTALSPKGGSPGTHATAAPAPAAAPALTTSASARTRSGALPADTAASPAPAAASTSAPAAMPSPAAAAPKRYANAVPAPAPAKQTTPKQPAASNSKASPARAPAPAPAPTSSGQLASSASLEDPSHPALLQPTGVPPAALIKPSAARAARPVSAPNAHAAKVVKPSPAAVTPPSATQKVKKERPASAMVTTPRSEHTPSYARHTAASKAATRLGEPSATDGSAALSPAASTKRDIKTPPEGGPSPRTGEEGSPYAHKRTPPAAPVFANIRASLLKPTKAFLAWASGNSRPEREAKAALGSSQVLRSSSARGGSTRLTGSTKLSAAEVRSASKASSRSKSEVHRGPQPSASEGGARTASGIPRPKLGSVPGALPPSGYSHSHASNHAASHAEALSSATLTPTSKIGAGSASAPASQRTTREVVAPSARPNGTVVSDAGAGPSGGGATPAKSGIPKPPGA